MDLFHNRYELEEAWHKVGEGWLAAAWDPKLKREVLLWRAAVLSDNGKEEVLRRLGAAARFSHRRFVHILDVSAAGNEVYAVLTKSAGFRLSERVHALDWDGREILEKLKELLPAVREARRERLQDFDVTADNLWLDSTGKLQFINCWSEGEAKSRDVYGLAVLLFQLCAGRTEPPVSMREFQQAVTHGLAGLPGGSAHEAAEWASSAFLPSCSMREFEAGIIRLLEPAQPQPAAPASPAPSRAAGRRDRAEPVMEARPERASIRVEEQEEGSERFRLKPWIWFTCVIVLAGFLGVIGIWYVTRPQPVSSGSPSASAGTASSPSSQASTSSPAGSTTGKQPTATPGRSSSPKPTASPKTSATPAKPSVSPSKPPGSENPPAAPGDTAQVVPDLSNRTLAEASELALKAGLRYEYLLEVNDQAEGMVFKQDLAPGNPVSKGDKIIFWVSKGQQQ
jgi:eukaryotic-like serine/threonine-protein kinase